MTKSEGYQPITPDAQPFHPLVRMRAIMQDRLASASAIADHLTARSAHRMSLNGIPLLRATARVFNEARTHRDSIIAQARVEIDATEDAWMTEFKYREAQVRMFQAVGNEQLLREAEAVLFSLNPSSPNPNFVEPVSAPPKKVEKEKRKNKAVEFLREGKSGVLKEGEKLSQDELITFLVISSVFPLQPGRHIVREIEDHFIQTMWEVAKTDREREAIIRKIEDGWEPETIISAFDSACGKINSGENEELKAQYEKLVGQIARKRNYTGQTIIPNARGYIRQTIRFAYV